MTATQLTARLDALTPQQRDYVAQFIDYLQGAPQPGSDSPFVQAAREFMDEHPELLQRLAQ